MPPYEGPAAPAGRKPYRTGEACTWDSLSCARHTRRRHQEAFNREAGAAEHPKPLCDLRDATRRSLNARLSTADFDDIQEDVLLAAL
jgi:hypothetical protein